MAEGNTMSRFADSDWKKPVPYPVDYMEFANYIEKQASSMERSGWHHEADHLRKWAGELRGKAANALCSFETKARASR